MFKVGDKVECVNVESTGGGLIEDHIYTVKNVSGRHVWIGEDCWLAERFKLVKEA
jgi:hypothetical protein